MTLSTQNIARRFRLAALLFAGAFLCITMGTGCGSEDDGICVDDYDCPSSQICVGDMDEEGNLLGSGRCEPYKCKTDDDCGNPDHVCKQNLCEPKGSD